jgi:hypothetical protein
MSSFRGRLRGLQAEPGIHVQSGEEQDGFRVRPAMKLQAAPE